MLAYFLTILAKFSSSWFNFQPSSACWLSFHGKLFCMHALLFLTDSEPRQQRSRRDCCSKNPCKQELHACPAVCNPVWAPPAKVETITFKDKKRKFEHWWGMMHRTNQKITRAPPEKIGTNRFHIHYIATQRMTKLQDPRQKRSGGTDSTYIILPQMARKQDSYQYLAWGSSSRSPCHTAAPF